MWRGAILLVMTLVAAGCSAPPLPTADPIETPSGPEEGNDTGAKDGPRPEPPRSAAPDAGRPAPSAAKPAPTFAFACPPGGAQRDGICVRELAQLDVSLQEPFLAADPTRPGTFALGVNAGPLVSDAGPVPGPARVLLDVYVTEDAGKTWRLSRLPYVRTDFGVLPIAVAYASGDPALAFDREGTLHVSGMATPGGPEDGYVIFYTSTADLGRSWSDPITFPRDGRVDRNWIAVGPDREVYLTWQVPGVSSRIAWSPDSGATWSVASPVSGCSMASPPEILGEGTVLLACAEQTGETTFTGIRVLTLDKARTAAVPRSFIEHPAAIWPHLRVVSNGTLVLIFEDHDSPTVKLATSHDGGHTWSDVVDVRSLVSIEDERDAVGMRWAVADPYNGLHLILNVGGRSVATPGGIVYAALDLSRGATTLQEDLPAGANVPPASIGPPWGDDFYGVAFQGGDALVAWTRDRTVQIAKLVSNSQSEG